MSIAPTTVTIAACPIPSSAWEILYKPQKSLNGSESGWTAKMGVFIKDASYADTFILWAAGWPYEIDLGGGVTATRYIPLSHPDYYKLLCREISAEWTGSPQPTTTVKANYALYSSVKIELTFKSVPYNTDGGTPFMTANRRRSLETYSIGNTRYAFASGEPIDKAAALYVPTATYVRTLYQCLELSDDVTDPLLGTLNSVTLFGRPAGTMMFMGDNTSVTANTVGTPIWTRELTWNYRAIHWNYALDRSGQWGLVLKPDTTPPYTLADHTPLVQ